MKSENENLDIVLKKLRKLQSLYEGYEEGKKTEIYKPIADSHHESAKSIQLLG